MHPHSFAPSINPLLIPIVIVLVAIFLVVLNLAIKRLSGAKFKLNSPLLSPPEQDLGA